MLTLKILSAVVSVDVNRRMGHISESVVRVEGNHILTGIPDWSNNHEELHYASLLLQI